MSPTSSVSFAEHIIELRSRLMWVLLFVLIGGAIGYALHDRLLQILQTPLNDSLYYNTPAGAFSFVMKLCVTFGIIIAIPALSYHTFAFLGPIVSSRTKSMFVQYVFMSVVLAAMGIAFAYFVSLPASLHFLTTFGEDGDINALITANEYFNFVLAYVAGFALLFQVPLIIAFTNRITPLQPKQLLGATRYVVVISFIAAAIITPTPDPMNQAIMAGPIIALYLLSIIFVALHPKRLKANRLAKKATKLEAKTKQIKTAPTPTAMPKPLTLIDAVPAVAPARTTPSKPRTNLISDFMPKQNPLPRPRPQRQPSFIDVIVT